MVNQQRKPISWVWIILTLIFFWPIGIILLFVRMTSDKTAALKNSKTIAIISYVLMGFGVIYLIGVLRDPLANDYATIIIGFIMVFGAHMAKYLRVLV